MSYVADLPHRLGRRAHPGRPAQPALRPPPAPLARLLRAEPRGRDHQPADERRRGDRPARHRRRHEPRPEHADARRHGDPPLHPRLAARARDARRDPVHEHRDGDLPHALGPRVRARCASGSASSRRRSPRTSRGCASSRRSRASSTNMRATSARSPSATATSNMETVVLNGLYFPFVDLLSSVALAVVLGYGGYLYFQGDDHARDAVRLHALRAELLRPGAAALAALQHVPLGDGRARQDRRTCSTRSPRCATAPARDELPRVEGHVALRGRALRLRRRAGGAARPRPRRAGGDDGRARRPHRRRQVDDRQAARPLLRPARGPDHDRRARPARRDAGVAAPPARDRAAGGLPLRRHGAARTSPSAGPTRRPSDVVSAAETIGAARVHRSASRTATRRSCRSAARASRSASASSSRSPARCSPTRAS